MAIVWTAACHLGAHPIIGARRLDQLADNLAAVDVILDAGAFDRLARVSAIPLGFPHEFIQDTASLVYGPVGEHVDGRGRPPT